MQIRSRRMDEIAEKRVCGPPEIQKIGGESDEESELNVWLRTIKDILDDPNPSAIDFLDTLKLNLFASEIVVFTPKGELITLPDRCNSARHGLYPPLTDRRQMYCRKGQPQARASEPSSQLRRSGRSAHLTQPGRQSPSGSPFSQRPKQNQAQSSTPPHPAARHRARTVNHRRLSQRAPA